MSIVFTESQISLACGIPPKATERVVAAVTGLSLETLKLLRDSHDGPEYETTVSGITIYRRDNLIHWMYSHIRRNGAA